MKIAITGGSGDIGGAYLGYAAANASINALLRAESSLRPLPKHAKIHKFTYYKGNHYEQELLKDFIKSDVVVHFAALLNVKEHTLADYIAINALFTGLLAVTSSHQKKAPKFVYISSEMVYKLPNDKKLQKLAEAFVVFCKKAFSDQQSTQYNLDELAQQFISENKTFPFASYNGYALTKYLGEAIVLSLPRAAVIRITSAYGPGYNNLRLIPKLIINRLTGHNVTYVIEKRDFVYNADIHALIDAVISQDIVGTIDGKSGEIIDTDTLKTLIVHLTPTAYGKLIRAGGERKYIPTSTFPAAEKTLLSILGKTMPFHEGLVRTLRYHKELCYHQMEVSRQIQEFVRPGEKLIRQMHGSSAAFLFVVEDGEGKKVRKVAIRDGVEGNGIAKVKNEIFYYQFIGEEHKKLARMYPKLLDYQTEDTFSLETIEYLDGPNFYEEIQRGTLPIETYRESLQKFIGTLCNSVIDSCRSSKNDEDALNVYYLERALYRLQPIKDLIKTRDTIMVNGKELVTPHIILNDLLENQALRKFITPQLQGFCFHGDMTLLNTVYLKDTNQIRLIDPRGYTGKWDPLYDFGKLKMTLDGFGEFIVGKKQIVSKTKQGYKIDFDQIPHTSKYLGDNLFTMLESNKKFNEEIISHEPYWQHRITLAAATHFLADIPFRLYTDNTVWTAIASYVVGTYYLNKVYEVLKQETLIK